MKLKHLLLTGLVTTFTFGFKLSAQRDGVIQHQEVINPPLTSTQFDDGRTRVNHHDNYVNNSKILPVGCDTLSGSIAPNNGNNGIMFNVIATQQVRLDFFNCFFSGPGAGTIIIFAKNGSFIGYETSDAGWSVVDSVVMNIPANGKYRIPIYLNHEMNFFDTTAFYITFRAGNTAGVDYTNGNGVVNIDSIYNFNTSLRVTEGYGTGSLFDAGNSPRVFTGNIEYCLLGYDGCTAQQTTFAGGNGAAGNIFNISTNEDIMINGFSGHLLDTAIMKVYYRYGSYAGHEATAADWVFADSALVAPMGASVPTPFFSNLNIPLNDGETMAFYITANDNSVGVDYTDGTAEGALYAFDGIVKIYEGLGVMYPFGTTFTPRIYNGIIDYCFVDGFIGIEENQPTNKGIKVYPVPTNNELYFDFNQVSGNRTIYITDLTGRQCMQFAGVNANMYTIQTVNLTTGIYLYTIYNGNVLEQTGKFIKQ